MTATMAAPDLDGFTMAPLDPSDSAIEERLRAFLRRYGLPENTQAMAGEWWGFRKDGRTALVVGFVRRQDGSIELTDFYPEPSRVGIKAGILAADFLKALVDAKKLPYFVLSALWRNRFIRRHLDKYVGTPACVVYCYNGEKN